MTTLSQIQSRVEDVVLELGSDAAGRVSPEILEAMKEIEEAHGFLHMEQTQEIVTVEDARDHASYAKDALFLRTRMDARPVLVDGTGATRKIDWLISKDDEVDLYSDDPVDKGAPKHLYETATAWRIFPYPDALAPSGTLFSDGNWRVRIPCFYRIAQPGTPSGSNWWTDNAEQYLVHRAAARVLAFNRDWEEAALVQGEATVQQQRLIANDKRQRLAKQRLLRPNRGARGSAYQARGLR